MGFDDEVDRLKRELQTPKLDIAGRKGATEALSNKIRDKLQTRRLEFVYEGAEDPVVVIKHTATKERLATVTVNEDGSITFQSALPEDDIEDDYDDAGYFPPYVEYYDEAEFMDEAPEMLKQGIAEYELDQEEA